MGLSRPPSRIGTASGYLNEGRLAPSFGKRNEVPIGPGIGDHGRCMAQERSKELLVKGPEGSGIVCEADQLPANVGVDEGVGVGAPAQRSIEIIGLDGPVKSAGKVGFAGETQRVGLEPPRFASELLDRRLDRGSGRGSPVRRAIADRQQGNQK